MNIAQDKIYYILLFIIHKFILSNFNKKNTPFSYAPINIVDDYWITLFAHIWEHNTFQWKPYGDLSIS